MTENISENGLSVELDDAKREFNQDADLCEKILELMEGRSFDNAWGGVAMALAATACGAGIASNDEFEKTLDGMFKMARCAFDYFSQNNSVHVT